MEAILRMLNEMKQDTEEIRKLLGIKLDKDDPGNDKDESMDVDGAGGMTTKRLSEASKQFEILRIKMLFFVSSGLLQSKYFVKHIVENLQQMGDIKKSDPPSKAKVLQKQLKQLIEISILNMESYETSASKYSMNNKQGSKRSRIQHQLAICSERVLESALAILPTAPFVQLLTTLLSSSRSIVRKKALDVFNAKLQQISTHVTKGAPTFLELEKSLNQSLLTVLVTIAMGKVPQTGEAETSGEKAEPNINQQTALICLRSFARVSSLNTSGSYLSEIKESCEALSKRSFLNDCLSESDESVIAAVLLCLTEMLSSIGRFEG